MGVVYYGNYFTWFEVWRNEFFRETNISYKKLEEQGVYLPVVRAKCDYLSPARYDDELQLVTEITKFSGAKLVFGYRVENEMGQVLAIGETVHAFVSDENKPISLKKKYPEVYEQIQSYVGGD